MHLRAGGNERGKRKDGFPIKNVGNDKFLNHSYLNPSAITPFVTQRAGR